MSFRSLDNPTWRMRDVHGVDTDVPVQWTRFIRTLESPHQGMRVSFMADDLPAGYVPRLKEFEELAGSLLDPKQEEPVAFIAALKGAGGYGKTTLAKALCHDERIQDVFHDGILWVTLGEQPNTMAGLTKLYAALTEERPNFVDEEDASARLAEVLGDKDCLMHTLRGNRGMVRAVALTVDGRRAVLASDDWTCKVWDVASSKEVATFVGESVISCCAVSPDCRTIVVGEQSGRVHILRLEGGD